MIIVFAISLTHQKQFFVVDTLIQCTRDDERTREERGKPQRAGRQYRSYYAEKLRKTKLSLIELKHSNPTRFLSQFESQHTSIAFNFQTTKSEIAECL